MSRQTLLIIWHSRTGASQALAQALHKGAAPNAKLMRARDVEPGDLLDAQAYLFAFPENLASMSGEMKEMFDRCYYPVLGKLEGRAYASIIAAGSDGEGAQRQLERIATGWRLKRVAEPLIVNFGAQTAEEILAPKSLSHQMQQQGEELGQYMKESLILGIF